MLTSVVLTVIGPDRPGLVDAIATAAAEHGANWLESRMARVAGQFAGVIHLHVEADRAEAVSAAMRGLSREGLTITAHHAGEDAEAGDRATLRLELLGHDRTGIVREVTHALAAAGVNVVDLETSVGSAPMTGEIMFKAAAELTAPADTDLDALRDRLAAIADELHLDLSLSE